MLKKMGTLTTLSLLVLLTACSGGGGGAGGGSSYGSSITAQFIDAPVKGLRYSSESTPNSQTGDQGKFSCKRGELVKFSLGGLDLGYAACGDKIFIQDLASNEPNYSWDQAAAILQTFALNQAGQLDLSVLDQDKLDLSGVQYQATATNLNLTTVLNTAKTDGAFGNFPPAEIPAAPVAVATARSEANNSFSTHISLPSQLQMVLEQLKTSGEIELDGVLVSQSILPGVDECWSNIKAKASVTHANGVYTFSVDSAVSFDDESVLDANKTCSSQMQSADECETATPAQLPRPKIITGSKFDMIFSNSSYQSAYQATVTSKNVLSVDASLGNNKVNFTGILENKVTAEGGPYAGKSISCKYKVTGSKVVSIVEDDDSYNTIPVAGTFSGPLICNSNDNGFIDISARVVVSTNPAKATISLRDGNDGMIWDSFDNLFVHDVEKDSWSFETIMSSIAYPFSAGTEVAGNPLNDGNNKFELYIQKDNLMCNGTLDKE